MVFFQNYIDRIRLPQAKKRLTFVSQSVILSQNQTKGAGAVNKRMQNNHMEIMGMLDQVCWYTGLALFEFCGG